MGSKIERAIYARELIPHPKSAQPGKPLHCLGPGMSGLKPILKLGVPVRDRPPTTASVRPVRGPGAALFPEAFRSLSRTKLPAHISPRTLAHARLSVSSTGPSPARARPHLRPPPRRRSVHTTRVAQATSSCTSTYHPPTSCRRRGGASPSAPSASSCCTRSCPSSSCRRSTEFGRAGARQHPPHPRAGLCAPPPRAAPVSLPPAPLLPPLTASYPLLPLSLPPNPLPLHLRRTGVAQEYGLMKKPEVEGEA